MSFQLFQQQLLIGQVYEEKAIERVIQYYKHKHSLKCRNNDNRFDFEMSNGKLFEVKADMMALKTGNVFIEVIGFNKPAGLAVTQAHYYIIMYHSSTGCLFEPIQENYVMVTVKKLRKLLSDSKDKYHYYSDEYKAGYLVPIQDIVEAGILFEW